MSGRHRSLLWIAAVTALVVVLSAPSATASWSWDGQKPENEKVAVEEPLEAAESMTMLTGEVIASDRVGTEANATAVDEIVDSILSSSREGRNLNGFDELYKDPSVVDAIQNADDVSARNLIKDKLCDLGLSSCDFEDIEGKRPYLRPQDLIYAQPVAIRPVGHPIPSIPYQQGHRGGPPPNRGGNGPYGPPRPMPPPRKVGYEGPPQSFGPPQKGPYYSGPPSSSGPGPIYSGPPSSGPSYSGPPSSGPSFSGNSEQGIYYGSKPPGPIFEGPEPPPYAFESHSSQNKIHTLQSVEKPAVLETPANTVQQHVHHHFHHGDDTGGKVAIPVQVPVISSGLHSTLISNELNSQSFSTSGGFNPISGDLKTAHSLNGLHTSSLQPGSVYPVSHGPKPIYESNQGNQGPNTFNSGPSGSGSFNAGGNGGLYSSQTGSYHTSNPDLYKKELNPNGPAYSNGLSSYASGNKQQQSYLSGNYYSNNAGGYQGQETARQENFDCVCVPYEQCPAHDVIGRKDDGPFLNVDPRNTGTNIEALADEAVLTDNNGTMTIVRVTKGTKNETAVEADAPKKISKRDVKEAESKSDDGKANVEPVSITDLLINFYTTLLFTTYHRLYQLLLYLLLTYIHSESKTTHTHFPLNKLHCSSAVFPKITKRKRNAKALTK